MVDGPPASRLLLVNPDGPVRAAVERLIKRQKLPYTLETAASQREAIERLHRAPCDVVVLDCTDGGCVTSELLDQAGRCPIVLLVDCRSQEMPGRAVQQGACFWAVDPGDEGSWSLLPAVVEHAVAHHHTLAELRQSEQRCRRMMETANRQLAQESARRESAEAALLASEDRARRRLDELAHLARVSTIGEMVAGVAHELNQPLSAIANYARACRHQVDLLSGEDRCRLLDRLEQIAAQADRAGQIIGRLRAFVRRTEPQRSTVGVNDLVRDAVALLEAEARSSGVRLELSLGRALPEVAVDRVQIEQVMVNLIGNAVEAARDVPDGRRAVTICTSLGCDGLLEVAVEDTGKGIQPQQIGRLFEPFYTTKPNGMGLGLSISRSIIEAHGGRLEAAPGTHRGATFRFTLPTEGQGGEK